MFIQVDRSTMDRTSEELKQTMHQLESMRGRLRGSMGSLSSDTRYRSDVDGTYRQIHALLEELEADLNSLSGFTKRKAEAFHDADINGRPVWKDKVSKAFEHTRDALTFLPKVGFHVGVGIVKGAWGMVKGIAGLAFHMNPIVQAYKWITDPEGQIEAWRIRADMIMNPGRTARMIWDGIKSDWNNRVTNGSLASRSEYAGEMLFNIGSMFVGVGAVGAASKTAVALNGVTKTVVAASRTSAAVTRSTGMTARLTGASGKVKDAVAYASRMSVPVAATLGKQAAAFGVKAGVAGLTRTARKVSTTTTAAVSTAKSVAVSRTAGMTAQLARAGASVKVAVAGTVRKVATTTASIGTKTTQAFAKLDVKGMAASLIGDPIHTATGAQLIAQPVLKLYGAAEWPLELHYNSLLLQRGTLGVGWTHTYESALVIESEGKLQLQRTPSARHLFTRSEDDCYRSADDAVRYDRITADASGFTWQVRETGEHYRFTPEGELAWIRNSLGQRLLAEHGDGCLQRLTDEGTGMALSFVYEGELLACISDGSRELTFTYDERRHLVQYTEPAGHPVAMVYTEEGRILEGRIGGELHFVNTYDEQGCIIAQQDRSGGVTKLSYDTATRPGFIVTTVIDRSGRQETFVHDAQYLLVERHRPGMSQHYAYNAAGQLVSQQGGAGEGMALTYDPVGRLLSVTDAEGAKTQYTYAEDESSARPLTRIDALGGVTYYRYETLQLPETSEESVRLIGVTRGDGEQAGVVYNEAGQRIAATDFGGATSRYAYGEDGRLFAVTDAEGRRAEVRYDSTGRINAVVDPAGNATVYDYDANDNLLLVTDPLGRSWSHTYDAMDRLVRAEQPSGAATTYAYGVHTEPERIVDPLGREMIIAYDGEGRVLEVTDAEGVSRRYGYDPAGRLAYAEDALGHRQTFTYDEAGRYISARDAMDQVIEAITYDKAGRSVAVASATGAKTTYRFNALRQLESVVDALGRETTFAYDAAGRLTKTQEAGAAVYRQQYEAGGELASATDANGNETKYRYDKSGALTEETRADGGVSTYAYESRGLLALHTSPSGKETRLTYDAAGQLVSKTDEVGAIELEYDADGRLHTLSENGQTAKREYDAAGQLIRYTDGRGYTIGYAYDRAGRMTAMTYPDGKQVAYRYDETGRLSEVKDWAGRLTRYRYDANGRLLQSERPNRTVERRTYNAAGQLTDLQDIHRSGIPLQHIRYTYNEIGQIVTESDKQYRYDELRRLVHSASPGKRSWYAYDAGGNLTETGEEAAEGQGGLGSRDDHFHLGRHDFQGVQDAQGTQGTQGTHHAFAYTTDNRLKNWGGYPVEWDADGNLLYVTDGKGMDAYTYDGRNRLIASMKGRYTYDVENRRIAMTEKTATGQRETHYVWDPSQVHDGLDHMLMELDEAGQVRAYYIYGHGLIGREDAAGNYRAYHYDVRGSTTLLTDERGSVTDRYSYGVYGEEEGHDGKTQQPYRYNGRDGVITDRNGLVYMRARYYHPSLKRFLNRDVIRGDLTDGQTFNRYAYVNGDPIRYIDPLGLCKQVIERFKYPFGGKSKSDEMSKNVDFIDESGRLGGKLYNAKDLNLLGNYLERRGIALRVGDEFLPPKKGGAFDFSTGTLFLRSNPTQYEVWHELSHYIQYRNIGKEGYSNLPRTNGPVPMNDLTKFNAPEQYVYDMLSNSKRWDRLNETERNHANWYIDNFGGIR